MTALIRILALSSVLFIAGLAPATAADTLPKAAQCYFDAVAMKNSAAVAGCMAGDAYVVDFGKRITGPAPIAEWADKNVIGGKYTLHQVVRTDNGVRIMVTYTPRKGKPVFARYVLTLKGGKIKSMVVSEG